jgi:hypothetical protein
MRPTRSVCPIKISRFIPFSLHLSSSQERSECKAFRVRGYLRIKTTPSPHPSPPKMGAREFSVKAASQTDLIV